MADTLCITPEQLRVGLYVHLDLKWFEHPFTFNSFLIRTEAQLRTLRNLGLEKVRYEPGRSEAQPLTRAAGPLLPVAGEDLSPLLVLKRAMAERIRQRQEAADRIADAFAGMARSLREIDRHLVTRPRESVRQAKSLVTRIADALLCDPDLAIHVMGEKAGSEEKHLHPLNVALLSLAMAREIRLPAELAAILGLGALFHDIGRREIPAAIFTRMAPLNGAEQRLYEMHCRYGGDIGLHLNLDPMALNIIREHHELFDGSGYPARLKGEAIGLLSRIVVIANHFDELCNPANVAEALTPHEALSAMFAKAQGKFDPNLLQVFIRCLGVYPPGTPVQLSNGFLGMVAAANPAKPLRPLVVVYDEQVPREEAILVDLEREEDINVVKAIRPAQLPREIYQYLSPRRRVGYYFDAPGPSQEAGSR